MVGSCAICFCVHFTLLGMWVQVPMLAGGTRIVTLQVSSSVVLVVHRFAGHDPSMGGLACGGCPWCVHTAAIVGWVASVWMVGNHTGPVACRSGQHHRVAVTALRPRACSASPDLQWDLPGMGASLC